MGPSTEILRRETVPKLWTAYSRVGPSVGKVADDSDHGSAYLSVRALEVLRDGAGSFAERAPQDGARSANDERGETTRERGGGWTELATDDAVQLEDGDPLGDRRRRGEA